MAQNEQGRRPSLIFPILLIALGTLFLYATFQPAFDPWPILSTYWPLILVFVGLGKIWDYSRRRKNPQQSGSFSVGTTIGVLAFVLVLIVLLWHGKSFSRAHGFGMNMKHANKIVDREGAQTVHASVNLGSGNLTIAGGADHLLDASFDYREDQGGPEVDYNVSGKSGDLKVHQDNSSDGNFWIHRHNSDSSWDLHFGNDASLDLDISLGAGEGHLRLRDVPVTKLNLNIGAGRVEADLTGNREKDLDAEIHGGVGEAVVHLPKNVGVIVNASGGIGSIDAHGLSKDGSEYTNEVFGHTPATIHLNIEGGIGHIALMQEP